MQHVPHEQQDAVRPGADLDVRLDLPRQLLLAGERRQPAGQPARRLPDPQAGDEEDLRRRQRLLVGTPRREPGDGAGAERQRAGRRHLVRAARHHRLLERHRQDRRGAARHGDRHPRRQRRDRVLQAVQDRPALERDQDGELPDGRRDRSGDRRPAPGRDGHLDRVLQGQPEQGQSAVRPGDDEEVRRQGADRRRRGGCLGRDLHPRPRAQEREVHLRDRRDRRVDERQDVGAARRPRRSRTATTSPSRPTSPRRRRTEARSWSASSCGSRRYR